MCIGNEYLNAKKYTQRVSRLLKCMILCSRANQTEVQISAGLAKGADFYGSRFTLWAGANYG